jgi:hypothetical protein
MRLGAAFDSAESESSARPSRRPDSSLWKTSLIRIGTPNWTRAAGTDRAGTVVVLAVAFAHGAREAATALRQASCHTGRAYVGAPVVPIDRHDRPMAISEALPALDRQVQQLGARSVDPTACARRTNLDVRF